MHEPEKAKLWCYQILSVLTRKCQLEKKKAKKIFVKRHLCLLFKVTIS